MIAVSVAFAYYCDRFYVYVCFCFCACAGAGAGAGVGVFADACAFAVADRCADVCVLAGVVAVFGAFWASFRLYRLEDVRQGDDHDLGLSVTFGGAIRIWVRFT